MSLVHDRNTSVSAAPRSKPLDTPASSAPPCGEPVEVTVVMPCLDEALTVGGCVAKALGWLESAGVAGEVIVADNGSTDGSREIAAAAGARVVAVEARGYGNALQAGIAAARGRFVIMGDADDSYDFTRIDPFVARLREGYDLVIGNRFLGGIRPGAMPWHHRYIGNPVLTGILNLLFRSPIGDAHCGLRGFRSDSYRELGLSSGGMEFASEMVVKACLRGQQMAEVPIVLHPDGRDRPPHLRSFRDGWRHLRFLLVHSPLWLYLIPAGVIMCLGLLALVLGSPAFGFAAGAMALIAGSLSVVLAYQAIWLWAFAHAHGVATGEIPGGDLAQAFLLRFQLEKGLIFGTCVFLLGLAPVLWLAGREFLALGLPAGGQWAGLPVATWCLTLMALGCQTIYGSFLLSTIGPVRRNP